MPMKKRGLAALFALLAMVFGFSGVAAAVPESPDTTAATSSCTARPITTDEISAEYIRTLDGRDFAAYKAVEFGFGLTLAEGHCEGDSITFTPPAELGSNGSPVDLATDNGVVIAHAVYRDGKVSVTLTNAVENTDHYAFEGYAFWRVSMKDTIVPGETRDLLWDFGGTTRRTQIHVESCPGCEQPEKWLSKWGYIPQDNPSKVLVTVATPVATVDNQEFLVRDVLTSSGQEFNCAAPAGQAGVYSTAGVWGQPQYSRYTPVTVVECTSTTVTLKLKLNAGEKARFELTIGVSPTDPGPWTDSATVTSQERSWDASATVRRAESGGGASYLLKPPEPTPSPSATPTPTPTPEPTPTPSVTPSTTPSATPSATPSPSATATPTPSVTPTPKATPSATAPAASPTPTRGQEVVSPPSQPLHKRPGGILAVTGTAGDQLLIATVAFVATGVMALIMGWFSRRSSREE